MLDIYTLENKMSLNEISYIKLLAHSLANKTCLVIVNVIMITIIVAQSALE